MKKISQIVLSLTLVMFLSACGSNEGVYFVNLEDGAEVGTTFKVEMGVKGMEVEPAGEVVKGKGHHIVVDGTFIPTATMVPADEKNIHYGKGQTETELTLTPGEHTLTLQFANGLHQSYGEAWSKTIKITVKE
uniref:DUF4399 domain-containing protein n=1 Tax=Roseivirga sp. TaxID=1964215 RepID=UPI004047BAF4